MGQYNARQYSAMRASTAQCAPVQRNARQYSAMRASTAQCAPVQRNARQHSAMRASTAQCAPAQRNARQYSAMHNGEKTRFIAKKVIKNNHPNSEIIKIIPLHYPNYRIIEKNARYCTLFLFLSYFKHAWKLPSLPPDNVLISCILKLLPPFSSPFYNIFKSPYYTAGISHECRYWPFTA